MRWMRRRRRRCGGWQGGWVEGVPGGVRVDLPAGCILYQLRLNRSTGIPVIPAEVGIHAGPNENEPTVFGITGLCAAPSVRGAPDGAPLHGRSHRLYSSGQAVRAAAVPELLPIFGCPEEFCAISGK